MNRLMVEVKASDVVTEKMKAYLRDEEDLDLSWQRPEEDFFGNRSPQGSFFKAFAPYFRLREHVVRTFVPSVWYTRALNGIYHFHKKNNERILVLAQYQNDEGKGFATCVKFEDGKGDKIAYLHN